MCFEETNREKRKQFYEKISSDIIYCIFWLNLKSKNRLLLGVLIEVSVLKSTTPAAKLQNVCKPFEQKNMRKIITLTFLVLLAFNSYSQTDKELILKSFENYKNAILTDKGKLAADFVDSRTINYYSTILDKVKTADSLDVNSMGIIDKLIVLTMRHRVPKKDLLNFNGKDLFIYAIDHGMVGKNSVVSAELGDVVTNGDFSKAEFVVNGQKTPFFLHFYREDNVWRIDITHLFSLGTMSVKKMIEASGKNENDFISHILEVLTGKKPTANIWKPLR